MFSMEMTRRHAVSGLFALPILATTRNDEWARQNQLVQHVRAQIGVTTGYDPRYISLPYPMGDVPRTTGVCIDVVVRAYRDAFGFDFQKEIHEDMRENFSSYPTIWGLSRTDRNIDHRRVPNMETWLARSGYEQPARDWQPGDILSCRLSGNLPHIGIITSKAGHGVHNIGAGAREEIIADRFSNERRFRFLPST